MAANNQALEANSKTVRKARAVLTSEGWIKKGAANAPSSAHRINVERRSAVVVAVLAFATVAGIGYLVYDDYKNFDHSPDAALAPNSHTPKQSLPAKGMPH